MDLLAALILSVQQFFSPTPPAPIVRAIPQLAIISQKPKASFGALIHTAPLVLGAQTATPTIATTAAELKTALATLDPGQARKKTYTIAIVGDSMVDTLGPHAGGLDDALKQLYPDATFAIKNHGVGAENIDSGIARLSNGYSYLGVQRPSVFSERPDVIILESFGYNPYADAAGSLNRHWLALAEAVRKIRTEAPGTGIIIATTIAPNWLVFADGAPGLHFSASEKKEKVMRIKELLDSTIAFAKGERLPLADAYTPSMDPSGNGKLEFINSGDHIHYSEAGRVLFALSVAKTLVANELLE